MSPLIGITTYNGSNPLANMNAETAYLPDVYADAIRRTGGRVILLPSGGGEEEADETVGNVDGIVLPGGPDLNPVLYGQAPHPMTSRPDSKRDEWEMLITKDALVLGVPLLGICRGMQVLNVTLGGTLHQHIPDLFEDAEDEDELVDHGYEGRGFTLHPVIPCGEGFLPSILGEDAMFVSTRHHQAVDRLGSKLIQATVAQDGITEAVELESDDQFAVGVQWHPERGDDPRLFEALIKVADRG